MFRRSGYRFADQEHAPFESVHGTIDSLLRVEWRPLAELAAIAADWRALAGRSLEPNVFYEPAFALAAASVFGRDVGAGLIWSRSATPRLVGVFPARIERRYGVPLPVLTGWTHPYAPLGAPLIDADAGEAVLDAWLDHVAHDPRLPKTWLLPLFPIESALGRALDSVVARRGGASVSFGEHRRALLAPGATRAGYLDDAIGASARSCGGSASGSARPDSSPPAAPAIRPRSRRRSTISSPWKRAAGRAAPEPRLATMPTSPHSCERR
jgi:hypothetical protein